MSTVIEAVGFASGRPCPHRGQYLRAFDFEAFAGVGYGDFTPDKRKALKFADIAAAYAFWRTVSRTHPVRADGQPNRPMTGLTVTFAEA
ncbi:MAG TPA: hypothetical protein VK630_04250 [Reyranella sp.]|nr:hypothetical protein [Reyranella sp.]